MKSFGLDGPPWRSTRVATCTSKPAVACGTRHRQAMGDEIPIFGDQVDERGGVTPVSSAHVARFPQLRPPVPPPRR